MPGLQLSRYLVSWRDPFFLDQNGLLWMGMMGGGLRLLDRERVFSYFTRDGLFDNEIYGIAEDNLAFYAHLFRKHV